MCRAMSSRAVELFRQVLRVLISVDESYISWTIYEENRRSQENG